ncbi:MAG: NAD(+) diphosphatase [Pseudomonadota bacterium]
MKNAETVTFGGSGLDRAAQMRGDAEQLQSLLHQDTANVLAFWRGKPFLNFGEHVELAMLRHDNPIFQYAQDAPIFLGREGDQAVFARDISAWEPEEMPETLGAFFDPSEQSYPGLPEANRFAELRGVMTTLDSRQAELAATAKAIFAWHGTHGFCARCGAQTQISMAGWQSDCPSCGAHHFPRTDPVVIMLITYGNSVLMGRSPGWPEGMYSLLAGFVEPGETIEAAVRRETFEEAGVRVGPVRYLASQPWPFPASLMFGCQGEAEDMRLDIDPSEIEDACWVSREEMLAIFAGESETMKPARKGAIAHFLLRNWLADALD